MLTKKAILEASDILSEVVEVPEWGGEVMVFGMTAGEKDSYEEGLIATGATRKVTLKDATARLCSLCIRDDEGNRVFSDTDIAALTGKAAKPMERISKTAQRLSGMGKGDIEEIVKNSEAIQSADSD